MKSNYKNAMVDGQAWVTLLTDETYTDGVILLQESLKKVKSKFPLYAIITDEVSAPCLNLLEQAGIKTIMKDTITVPDNIAEHNTHYYSHMTAIWRNCLTKLHAFDLTEFKKVVFLDADVMVLQNMDELFTKPHMTAALDGEYHNIWPDYPHFNAGCIVIEPSHELFESLYNFTCNLKDEEMQKQIMADQEVLNLYYSDWAKHPELHLNKYYNIFGPYVQEEELEDIKPNVKFIHFIGRKPWKFFLRNNPAETYTEYYYEVAKGILKEAYQHIDITKAQKLVKLAVYAICKNEINNLDRWLKSYSKADYVCVHDTGSTDGTFEKLQEYQKIYPNLIIDQTFYNKISFDTARNDSMKLIPSDVSMFFMNDLDEAILEDDWADKCKAAWFPAFNRGQYTYHRRLDANGNPIKTMSEYRIHSREWTTWVNNVHELIMNRQGKIQFFVGDTTPIDITVWHFGADAETTLAKSVRYVQMCEEEVAADPENILGKLQLAIEYEVVGDLKKATETYEDLCKNHMNKLKNFELARSFFGYARHHMEANENDMALYYMNIGRLEAPFYADNYLAAAEIYLRTQHYREAAEMIKLCITNCTENLWCSVYNINGAAPFEILARSLALQNDFFGAYAAINIACDREPENETLKALKNQVATDLKNTTYKSVMF